MNPLYLKDSLLAAKLFAVALIFLLCGSALGLNSFPLEVVTAISSKPSLQTIVMRFGGYSLVFAAMFWGSLPDQSMQRAVLMVWTLLTVILWTLLRNEPNFSEADNVGNWTIIFGTGLG